MTLLPEYGSGAYWLSRLALIFSVSSMLLVAGSLLRTRLLTWLRWMLRLEGTKVISSDLKDLSVPIWEWTSRWTNRWKGYANAYWVAGVCVFALAGFATVPFKHWIEPAPTVTAHYWYLPHVSEEMADNIYVILLLDRNDPLYGTRPRYTFCAQSKPIIFDEGELIVDVVYREHVDCKELVSYNLERDEHFHVRHYPEEAFNHGYGR